MSEILSLPDGTFVVWSNNTDGPLCWGTKEEVTEWLIQEIRDDAARTIERQIASIPDRFDRVARNGTSSFIYGDDDDELGFQGVGTIKRTDLLAFLKSWNTEDDTFDMSLVEPYLDDGPETPEEEAERVASGREAIRELVQSDQVQAHIFHQGEEWHFAGTPVMDENVRIDILVPGPNFKEIAAEMYRQQNEARNWRTGNQKHDLPPAPAWLRVTPLEVLARICYLELLTQQITDAYFAQRSDWSPAPHRVLTEFRYREMLARDAPAIFAEWEPHA